MATTLFVGKLSYNTTDDRLRELFAQHGTVESAHVIKDHESGISKGFAFVEMAKPEEAQAAIVALHDKELDGRIITVSMAKPRENRPRSGSNNGRSSFGRTDSRR